ncbi:MAG: DEAD/DEAH box helicase, partial [Proteobacteria bacterium]|nr:DEAD/DEAH box helicase [Candidatus Avisuccinivibrio stercorigallinarum]
GIKPETIPAGSDLDFVKQLYQPEVMTEQLQGLTLHLPAMERGENEVSLLPCYILFYKDGRRRVMTLKELFDENRSDSLLFALLRGCELYHFLSFAEFLPDELEVQSHGFDFSCELDQFESIIESMNQYCGSVRAGIEPRARFVTIPLYTVASSNIQTMELTDVLYIDLPDIVNLQLPDNYIDLESMLQFNWKLAVGSDTLSEDDFEKLRKNSGKIVKLHDKFVRADEKKLKNYREKIERLDRMNRHLLLLATLTGSYDGSDVVVGKKLEDARASIFAAGDNSLPRNLASDLTLRPYQVLGYSWLLRNARSGIGSSLADDMGLGKTVQLIAVLQKLKEEDELNEHPALIVVPSSVLINWKNELKRFAPQLQVYIYHGDKRSHENLTCHDVILSTYGTVRTSYKKLNGLTYSIIAVDEAQKIKNYASQSVKALKALKGRRYAALTGTPVENRLSEYWSIMDFVNPGLLGARTRFNAEIAVPIEKYRDPLALDRFKRMTGPFILRRVKTDKNIISDLPDKIVTDEFCSLTPAQVTLYQAVLDEIMQKIRDTSTVFTIERSALVLQLINSLKQICNSPVQYVSGRNIDHQYTAEDSGKVRHLFSLCGRLMENGHRTLIFTQYTVMGELLQAWMKKELKVDVPFIRGSLSPKQRQDIVDKFQSGDMPFLMLSLKAGGTGINLTKADAVIHFDLWWNPAVEEQATDRAYRIGQHNNVQVYRFITANTFEEKINAIIQSKKELSDLTVVSGSKWLGELSNDELADLFALTREDLS